MESRVSRVTRYMLTTIRPEQRRIHGGDTEGLIVETERDRARSRRLARLMLPYVKST